MAFHRFSSLVEILHGKSIRLVAVIFVVALAAGAGAAADTLNVFGGGGGGGGDHDGSEEAGKGGKGGNNLGENDGADGLTSGVDQYGSGGGGGGGYAGSGKGGGSAGSKGSASSGGSGGPGDGEGAGAGGNGGAGASRGGSSTQIIDKLAVGGQGGRTSLGGNGGDGGGSGGGWYSTITTAPDKSGGGAGGGGGGNVWHTNTSSNLGEIIVAAGEGGGGKSGGGGGGGHALLSSAALAVSAANLSILGGNGGDAGESEHATPLGERAWGGGGGGGAAVLHFSSGSLNLTGDLTVTGGTGGAAAGGGSGGGGGNAAVSADGVAIAVGGDLNILGGNAGASATGAGGTGGSAVFTAGNTAVAETLRVTSGEAADGIAGGDASMTLGSLTAPEIILTKQDGEISVAVGRLLVDDTAITLNGTAKTDVLFDAIVFTAGSNLDVSSTNSGNMDFNSMFISGVGSTFTGSSGFALDARRKALHFDLTGIAAGDAMLQADNHITVDDTTAVTLTKNDRIAYTIGDKVILIGDAAGGLTVSKTVLMEQGAVDYNFLIDTDSGDLVAVLGSAAVNQGKAKSYLFASAARMTILYHGNDLIAEKGVPVAMSLANELYRYDAARPFVFAAASYNDQRFDTGSNIDVRNANMLVGLGIPCAAGSSRAVAGPLLEGGIGRYDGYNEGSRGDYHADGKANYVGGGVMGRVDIGSSFFAEASGRAGRVWSDYTGLNLAPEQVEGKSATWYVAAHAGLGYDIRPAVCHTFTVYGYGFFTQQGADNYENNAGEAIDYNSARSLRSRAGVRYTYAFPQDNVKLYAGAAWEREYLGETDGFINGIVIGNPQTLKGDSYMAEAGAKWFCGNAGWEFDLSGKVFSGRREGYSVSAGMGKAF